MQDWYLLTDREILLEIGVRMKAIRISKNMTQQMLAERAGLNRTTIRDLETGKPLNLLSLIQVLRSMEMLSFLNELPGPDQSPVLASQQMLRKRVKLTKKNRL